MATTGLFWEPFMTLQGIMSRSENFQEWVGAESAEEALPFIHVFEERESLEGQDQACIILPPDGSGLSLQREGSGTGLAAYQWGRTVEIGWQEILAVGTTYTQATAEAFLSRCGAFLNDILLEDSRYLKISEVPWTQAPLRITPGSRKGYQKYLTLESGT